jgi:putative hydrolase of the HAD superfamily
MRYRAVFFDAGETLVHPHPSFPELFLSVLRDEGHDVDPPALFEGLLVVFERFAQAARDGERWTTTPAKSKAFWLSVYRGLLERLGLPPSEGLAERLYGEFTELSNYRLFTDVLPVLEDLRDRGVILGVVSNFEAWLAELLDRLAVTALFDVCVISGIEGIEKPDPEIFRLALHRARVAPKESVYVGDNPAFDTEPAASIGMLGVLLDRRERFPEHAGPRITTMADLPAAIGLAASGGPAAVP